MVLQARAHSPENYFGNGLGIPSHDYIESIYTNGNLTQVNYRRGGASGRIVATIVMTYDGNGNVLTLERTA